MTLSLNVEYKIHEKRTALSFSTRTPVKDGAIFPFYNNALKKNYCSMFGKGAQCSLVFCQVASFFSEIQKRNLQMRLNDIG